MRPALLLTASFWATSAIAGPMVHHIEFVTPRAGQRGTTVDVILEGTYIKDAREALFFGPGIKCLGVKALPSLPEPRNTIHSGYVQDRVQCRFQIAPDCPLGLHPFKLRTDTELTTLSTFSVTRFPVVQEGEEHQGGNDTLQTAKVVPLNTSVLGRIDSGRKADTDMYRVSGKAGMHLSVEVDSVRLTEKFYGGAEFDLMVRLLDANGRELASNDDSALHMQDPIISTILPRDDDYYVEIKQRVFSTGTNNYYLAHIGTNIRPLAVFPAGGPAGRPLLTTLLGDPAGRISRTIALPVSHGDFNFNEDMPSPLPMRVSAYENVLKDREAEETPVKSLPAALNGIIAEPGEVDRFRLSAKKGERWLVRVYARSLGTPLDPRIVIRRAASEAIEIQGDDSKLEDRGLYSFSAQIQRPEQMDPSIVWEPKEDGDYLLDISDMRGFGDPLSVYRVEIEPVRNEVNTYIAAKVIDGVECPRLTSIAVAQGNRWTVNIKLAEGQGNRFKGEMELVASGLPEGVRMIAPRIPAGAKEVQAQFIADASTQPQVGLIGLTVRAVDGTPLLSGSQQGFPFLNHSGGNAWNAIVTDRYALAVTDPAPFSFDLVQPQIPISKSGELALQVKVNRKPGFNDSLEFQCDWSPPGVQCEPTVTVVEGKFEALMHLNADANVKPGTWELALTASTTGGSYYLGAGRIRTSTNFVDLAVADPYVELKNHPSSVRRHGTAQIIWDVDNKKPFEGEADAFLLGLPRGVSVVGQPKLKAGDSQLVFNIAATDEALMGQYKELICEIVVKHGGQEIRQRSGKGILRVDPAFAASASTQGAK